MKEFKSIIEAYHKIDFGTQRAALATVVKVRGSSYRSPGARMLITDNGRWVGSISGGCLEGDALRKARQVMHSGAATTVTYDTREESNQKLGIGLGCNGVIDVLIEPVCHERNNLVALFESLIGSNLPFAVATIFEGGSMTGEKLIIDEDKSVIESISDEGLNKLVKGDLENLFFSLKTETKTYELDGQGYEVFLELLTPNIRVVIFGAGFDARPMSQFAKMLGWEVNVTDECVSHIAPVFFPDADKLSLCDRTFVDRDFNITPYTACILMSHNYEYDRDVLRKLINSKAHYIGILGPRKRFEKMLSELTNEGIQLSKEQLERIHSPIGLDIGAETPDEIALSVISEIKSRFSMRSGGFLKYRTGPIHQRDPKDGQIFKQIFINQSGESQAQI